MTETLNPAPPASSTPNNNVEAAPSLSALPPATLITSKIRTAGISNWQVAIALTLIILVGGYFRLVGINWDSGQDLHPDERFMTNVASAIQSVNLFNYFDTSTSTLNPFPYGSYTYGMFPLFVVRYVAELILKSNYDDISLVGRAASAIFDLAATVLLYFLGARLYDRRVGLLAAALYGAAVLPIQLSHYFTVDSFATVFIIAALLVAAPIMTRGRRWHYLLFGLFTGLAMACKINTAPLAGMVVVAGMVRLAQGWHAKENRRELALEVLVGWLIAGAVAALTFRVFQPYAFNGPSIFGLSLNQRWLDIMQEVTQQVAGNSEWPPNHHWTNRPQLTYGWIQTAVWGMGLPLGLAGTLGWAWAAVQSWRTASFNKLVSPTWQGHLLLVLWVGGYFAWQNAQFWRYMRYFMPIYPFAILLGAWLLIDIYDRLRARQATAPQPERGISFLKAVTLTVTGIVLLSTYAYAFAFTRIYTRPHTRVDASYWMFENIPGPLNAQITSSSGNHQQQPLAVPYDLVIGPEETWRTAFTPVVNGQLNAITSYRLTVPDTSIHVWLSHDGAGSEIFYDDGETRIPPTAQTSPGQSTILLRPIEIQAGETFYVHYTSRASGTFISNNISLQNGTSTILSLAGEIGANPAEVSQGVIAVVAENKINFDRLQLNDIQLAYPVEDGTVLLTLSKDDAGQDVLATAQVPIRFSDPTASLDFTFPALQVDTQTSYFIGITNQTGIPLQPSGALLAMETSWDDSLPLRMPGYDPFGGIYRMGNLELFEADTALKRDAIVNTLTRADYLVISSNRAYDAMPRLPLRYPMTLKYYQYLFQCESQPIYECAYALQTGFKSPMGYELVAVFESNPNLGNFEIDDQTAEEAFTVYDHPKVMLFKRTAEFSASALSETLNSIDLTQVLEQAPRNYTAMPTALRLPPDRLEAQVNAGTWSELFDRFSILNWYQPLSVAVWYLLLLLIGWAVFPILFIALRGLPDRGYPIAKLCGLVLLTWAAWFASSYKIVTFTQPVLWLILVVITFISGFFAYQNWTQLTAFVRTHRRHLLIVEGVTLALFLYFLWVRWLNPDLWHPWLGGEKPADYSFFLSAIKSIYFPGYDVWLSEHYVNYYYYGYVINAVPTKMLGIMPSLAYNLVLPTLFAFAGIGAFCAAYNLVAWQQTAPVETLAPVKRNRFQTIQDALSSIKWQPYIAGLAAAIMMVLLGNLYQVRQLWQYLPEVAEPPSGYSENIVDQLPAVLNGAFRVITGQSPLPGDKGRWYFGASRAILNNQQDQPITEFPYFSFLYADLHPHLTSMSLMLACMAWMMSLIFAAESEHAQRLKPLRMLEALAMLLLGGLLVGALLPTQTWDYPGFAFLGVVTIMGEAWLRRRKISRQFMLEMISGAALFLLLTIGLYQPFREWFATDYTAIEFWQFRRTPLFDYFGVHGLFLFLILTYLIWQSRSASKVVLQRLPANYLLNTPLGELLPRIRRPITIILGVIILILAGAITLWTRDYESVMFAVPIIVWLILFFFWPGQSLANRVWIALVVAGVGITVVVEFITLKGDLGRSNTVFKFYIEVWAFFSVAAGAALAWLWPVVMKQWSQRPRRLWMGWLGLLVAAAASYTVTATYSKTTDRWPGIDNPPHTLDGMAYMLGSDPSIESASRQAAEYSDEGVPFALASDYNAMLWLQQNVKGTPTIVEGNTPLYRWGSRISIYTGLPSIVGWDYHLKQHDSILPGIYVDNRVTDVKNFYNTTDIEAALKFLRQYNVQYIILGDLERHYYPGEGLEKFSAMVANGQLEVAFAGNPEEDATFIYHVQD